ncbi:MAG: non-ribosomal peptide synthetase, partial [Chloroflexi bacterium]|nr:non-ribosomal peptide synthetase [Chloroflexota bacterium]
AFVTLEALPLTPNGKLDRKALPAPELDQDTGDAVFVAPQTPIQELVAASWKEVLGLTQLGIHDNFFARGGHSLLATQLVSRLRKTFGIELPLRSIFETPTVAELAQQIEQALASGAERALPPLVPIARRPGMELPLSFAQQRLWFLNQLTPNSAFYNITLAVRLTGALDIAALRQSFNTMVERHEALRTSFSLSDRRPVQTIHAQLTLDVPLIDLSATPAAEREAHALQLATEDARRPFDLSQAPLMRITLLRLQPDEHLVVLTMHHIITDAWSFRVLMRELAALYTAAINGEPRSLPALPIQYADFASWQRQCLQGQLLESYAAVWQQRLAGPLPVLELPTDRTRSELQTFHGALESRTLSPELTQQLHSLSQRTGCTLFMTLLAAFNVLLHFYTGQRDVIVGSDVANRNRAETEGLIGFFVNQLVLRTSLDNNPSFQELLRRVRDVALEAYAYQDLPFDKLVELLNPERSLKYAPLFQVKLVLQNVPEQQYELPGLTMTSMEVDRGTSQLDLNLRIMQARDELLLSAEYSTDLFDAATIAHLLELYETLLGAVVAQPELKLEQLVAIVAEADQRYRQAQAQAAQDAGLNKLRSIKRKAAR